MIKITSKDNQKIKDLIKLRDDPKFRSDKSLFYVEGERIIKDTKKELIMSIFVSDYKYNNFKYICDQIDESKIFIVDEDVFEKIKDTNNSQGIIAIVKISKNNEIKGDFLLVLDNINDPGNLGTIIRLSEATGVNTILLSNDCCDIYNTKVIRASMSSIFRMNIILSDDIISDIINLKNKNYKILTTGLTENSINYKKAEYKNKIAIVIGNEANGVRKEILELSDYIIKIPMKGKIESLNASIATSIICYEAMNNRYEI